MNSEQWYNCEHPRLVTNRYTGELVQVNCGRCTACRSRKMQRWIAPLYREASCWKYSFFFTLTYNEQFLPKINLSYHHVEPQFKQDFYDLCQQSKDFIELHKGCIPYCPSKDIQLFLKRLRENIFRATGQRCTFRYFIHSDYGSTLFRPHWHGIIFTSNDYVASNIKSLVFQSWSLQNKSHTKRHTLGISEVEPAFAAAKYVSAYINAIDKLPAIYSFRDFRVRSYHSSHPSIGSVVKSLESVEDIVRNGLTKITVYSPVTFKWSKLPLEPSVVYRLFPRIPSYSSCKRSERLRIYQLLYDVIDLTPQYRRRELLGIYRVNSFFRDYISLNNSDLTISQLYEKFDRVFYAYKRLFIQAQAFSLSVSDYDTLIEQYYTNRYRESLEKQFLFEDRFMSVHNDNELLNNYIDVGYNENERHIARFDTRPYMLRPSARSLQYDYFHAADQTFNKLVKRKCDNAYLEKHPEFKKFHQ